MKPLKLSIFLLISIILLSSCGESFKSTFGGCPDGVIEWVDMLMTQDVKYQHFIQDAADKKVVPSIEKGKKIGKVSYQMADHACSNHQMKNGDAAYLDIGTPIYAVKGYPSTFLVSAGGKVYVATQRKKAKKANDLAPLDGLVKNIHIESTKDGHRISTFSDSSKVAFIHAWHSLKLGNPNRLIQAGKLNGTRVFLEIELNNGISYRLLYWTNSNVFQNGVIGNKKIQGVIQQEVKKAAYTD